MMRLIDATTLRAEFTGNFHELWHYTGIWAMIDNAPTVDAEPVRHGYWIAVDEYCGNAKEFKCSVCENTVEYGHYTRTCDYDYCPNCGAKMDEVQVKNCCNCKFGDLKMNEPPCSECDNNGSKWEGVK